MMSREDVRRENARALAAKAGGLAEFSRKTEMEPSQVSQLIGKTPSKNIGNIIAKRIEDAFNLARGTLDAPSIDEAARKDRGTAQPGSKSRSAAEDVSGSSQSPEGTNAPVAASIYTALNPALQWVTADEYQLLSQYRAATSGWRKAIQQFARDAEKEPSASIIRNKT